ncbi:interleukin-1 receptor type 2 isoform X1 [Lissotriton helveticus]
MLQSVSVVIAFWLLRVSAFRVQRLENAETCSNRITHFDSYAVQSGEPTVLRCPAFLYLRLDSARASSLSLNLTWYRNNSQTLAPQEDPRIQAKDDALLFFPSSIEDTGRYHCILRNSSYCLEVVLALTVVTSPEDSLAEIAYAQNVFTLTSGQIFCPNLNDFIRMDANWKLKWYKDNSVLPNLSTKFQYPEGTTYLQIEDVSAEDKGYYTCEITFEHTGKEYRATRIILLQTVEQEKKDQPLIVYPNHKAIAAAVGSRLIIPCKVFTGYGSNSLTVVWWLANNSYIDEFFQDGRVKEGQFVATTENDGNYIEVQLVFDEVKEEDFNTDFTCIANNDYGIHMLPAQLRPAESSFSWYVAAVPVAAVLLIAGAICAYRCRRARTQKGYALTAC